jgi:hypothetical protein
MVNGYSAGNTHYGGGRSMPNIGPVQNKGGYKKRDRRLDAKRQALLSQIQARLGGNHMSANNLRRNYGGN